MFGHAGDHVEVDVVGLQVVQDAPVLPPTHNTQVVRPGMVSSRVGNRQSSFRSHGGVVPSRSSNRFRGVTIAIQSLPPCARETLSGMPGRLSSRTSGASGASTGDAGEAISVGLDEQHGGFVLGEGDAVREVQSVEHDVHGAVGVAA